MPSLKTYDLFISHSWTHNDEYYRLIKLLSSAPLFHWRNYSVPEHDPKIDPSSSSGLLRLVKELDKQVRPSNCVIIIAGMFAAHSDWIKREIELANQYQKPIIGVSPRTQVRIPQIVRDNACEMVAWNTGSIVAAVRRRSI